MNMAWNNWWFEERNMKLHSVDDWGQQQSLFLVLGLIQDNSVTTTENCSETPNRILRLLIPFWQDPFDCSQISLNSQKVSIIKATVNHIIFSFSSDLSISWQPVLRARTLLHYASWDISAADARWKCHTYQLHAVIHSRARNNRKSVLYFKKRSYQACLEESVLINTLGVRHHTYIHQHTTSS